MATIPVPHGFYDPDGFQQACMAIGERDRRYREAAREKAIGAPLPEMDYGMKVWLDQAGRLIRQTVMSIRKMERVADYLRDEQDRCGAGSFGHTKASMRLDEVNWRIDEFKRALRYATGGDADAIVEAMR